MPPKPAPKAAGRGRAAPVRGGGATRGAKTTPGKTTAKAGPAKTGPAKQAQPAKPEPPKWTEKDDAAVKIQKLVRTFLANRRLLKKKKEKENYDAEMDRLEREAFVQVVRMQQEEAERQRQKEEEERRRIIEHNKRKKRMLEAAFDGEKNDILSILREVEEVDNKNGLGHDVIGKALRNRHQLEMINCEDPNGNTPLSEAASGGHPDIVQMLLDRSADINTKGQFRRTPLYRAAFAGHLSVCEVLLQNGGDPRIYAEDAQMPHDVATVGGIKELIQGWDITQTEKLLQKIQRDKEKRAEEEKKRREAEIDNIEKGIEEVEKEFTMKQKRLTKAYEELNKRIYEHDTAAAQGFDKPALTEQIIHDAEFELESAKLDFDKVKDKLATIKLELREKQKEENVTQGEDRPGIECPVRELDDVLFRDVGNRIKDTGKWPLIVDPSGQAATFLRYRDTNYINALSPTDMDPNKIRLAVLGAIRFGKPCVLDMMEVDMFPTCADRFALTGMPGLMDKILDKSIMLEENYIKLARKEDGDEYNKNKFIEVRVQNFKFFLITKNPFPSHDLLDTFLPIWVVLSGRRPSRAL